MKTKVLMLSLLILTVVNCGGSDIMDTKLNASNRDAVMQEAMSKMSTEEKSLLLAYIASHMLENMPEMLSGKTAEGSNDQWGTLPEGKSLNEILAEQKKQP